ncbi:MAG: class I SAM-dependent methyltransferase [Candidatus Saccharimonadales bacterium]
MSDSGETSKSRINHLDQVVAANASYYGDGSEVRAYQLEDPYHVRRVSIATEEIIATVRKGGWIVDLGAGSSIVADSLKEAGVNTVVADISSEVVDDATRRGHPATVFDASGVFPWEDESFDGVYAGELIEHVFDPVDFLAQCHRILRPKGALVLTTPNLAAAQDRIGFLFGYGPRHVNPLHRYIKYHIRPFTPRRLHEVVECAGFTPLQLKSNYWTLNIKDERKMSSALLARILPGLGGTLIMTAEKTEFNT